MRIDVHFVAAVMFQFAVINILDSCFRKLSHCNKRKLAAKTVQELHSELHLAALLRQSGSVEVKGVVLHVHDHSVDVVFFYLGIVRRVYLEVCKCSHIISVHVALLASIFLFRNCLLISSFMKGRMELAN